MSRLLTLLLCLQCCLHLVQLTDLEVPTPLLFAYIPNWYSDKSTHAHTRVCKRTHHGVCSSVPKGRSCLKASCCLLTTAVLDSPLWRQRLWTGAGRRAGAQELGPHPTVSGPVTFRIWVQVSAKVSVSGLFSSSQRHRISSACGTFMLLAGTNSRTGVTSTESQPLAPDTSKGEPPWWQGRPQGKPGPS